MKNKHIILLLITLLLPFRVLAAGGFSLSSSSISMYPGESKTVSISSDNSVGKLNISSSNSGVASVTPGSVFIQTPGSSGSITITAGSIGSSIISVVASSDYATMDEEILAGQTKTVIVNVISRPSTNTNPTTNPSNNTVINNNPVIDNRSTNANLKEITIDGYEIEKVDNNNYKLTVNNNITSINLKATPEDLKSKVSGTGSHDLIIGENNIELIITSESESTNKINIKVIRKDGFYLEDLSTLLNDKSIKDINILINKEGKLSAEDLSKIKASEKIINFNYFDENKVLKYSWKIDGSKIKETKEINFSITNNSAYAKDINKLSNYADGVNINFEHTGDLPKGTKIKLFVGDKYNDSELVNIYYYNKEKNKLESVKEQVKVKDKYVELELEHCSEYFITLSKIGNVEIKEQTTNIFMILFIVETILIIIYFIFNVINKKHNIDKTSNQNNFSINNNNLMKNEIPINNMSSFETKTSVSSLNDIENSIKEDDK